MGSSSFLLLMLMAFQLAPCSRSDPLQPSRGQQLLSLHKRGKTTKNFKTAGEYFLKIAKAVKPFIGLIPNGNYVVAILDFAEGTFGGSPNKEVLEAIKKEFENLNLKLDETKKQLEWSIETVSKYGKVETDISISWNKLQELFDRCASSCDVTKEATSIETFFKKSEKSLFTLHDHITEKGAYNKEYKELLSEHVRCHEDAIKSYAAINAELARRSITMTVFYKRFKKDPVNEDTLLGKYYDISSAMFRIHKECISSVDKYVKLDVEHNADDSEKDKDKLAKKVRELLKRTYTKYDLIAVVFRTDKSNRGGLTKPFNSHILSGFDVITRGTYSVGVAKQMKGTHSKASQVAAAFDRCLRSVSCGEVAEKLQSCSEQAGGVPVGDTYTAIHVYLHKKHESAHALSADEAPSEEFISPTAGENRPYIFERSCTIKKVIPAKYRILIKSDEEMTEKNPCEGLDCGPPTQGACVEIPNTRVGVCECQKGFYGENCEESVDEYRKTLLESDKAKIDKIV